MKYLQILLNNPEKILHTQDLSLLWGISGNTLHTAIKRYCIKKILHRVYRGMYIVGSIKQIDPLLLGVKAMNRYCYISTETILAQAGVISQKINAVTLISSVSLSFNVGGYQYKCRKLQDKYLFQSAGIFEKNNIKMATVERAAADMLYFNHHYYFDNPKQINWQKVKTIQKELYYI